MTAKKSFARRTSPSKTDSHNLSGDSAGVFLPLQEDVFPDTDDFGRVFRNNAVMSAMAFRKSPRLWNVRAGGAYLPVMCDHILMTEARDYFWRTGAGASAIGQKTSAEDLGGAKCTRKSAARWISASRMMMRASRAFERSSTKSGRQTLRRSAT